MKGCQCGCILRFFPAQPKKDREHGIGQTFHYRLMGGSQKDQGSPEETHGKILLPLWNVAFTDLTVIPELPIAFHFLLLLRKNFSTFPKSTNVRANSGQELLFSNTSWRRLETSIYLKSCILYNVTVDGFWFFYFFSLGRSKWSSMYSTYSVNFTFY